MPDPRVLEPETDPQAEARLTAGIDDREFMAGVDRLLRVDQRDVVLLSYVFGYEAQELAERLGKSPEAVRQIRRRAADVLRAHLRQPEKTVADRCDQAAASDLPVLVV